MFFYNQSYNYYTLETKCLQKYTSSEAVSIGEDPYLTLTSAEICVLLFLLVLLGGEAMILGAEWVFKMKFPAANALLVCMPARTKTHL